MNAYIGGAMMNENWIKIFYVIAGLYDGILGVAFILIVFAIMFFRVAADPIRNRELILYGCGLKISYCLLAFWYELTTGIPSMWIPWAWADLGFLFFFVLTWRGLVRQAQAD